MKFELLVAIRYLKAKRKQSVISILTLISIVGVAAGVAALIIALAVTAGFREDLTNKLLGAQAHLNIVRKISGEGIGNYVQLSKDIEQVPGVLFAAPAMYDKVLLSSKTQASGVVLKGIIPEMESKLSALSQNLVEGSLANFGEDSIIIGKDLAKTLGTFVGDRLQVTSIATRPTPIGPLPRALPFQVAGIFQSGLYDYDNTWVYVPMKKAQRLRGIDADVAGVIEVKVSDIYQAF